MQGFRFGRGIAAKPADYQFATAPIYGDPLGLPPKYLIAAHKPSVQRFSQYINSESGLKHSDRFFHFSILRQLTTATVECTQVAMIQTLAQGWRPRCSGLVLQKRTAVQPEHLGKANDTVRSSSRYVAPRFRRRARCPVLPKACGGSADRLTAPRHCVRHWRGRA